MADSMASVESILAQDADRYVEDLKALLRIPSVSADTAFHDHCLSAAAETAEQLEAAGCSAEIISTAGFPIVLGRSPEVPGASTVLVYGHYDVQPPDPLDEWETPAFEPTIRDGRIYARGATDDKGQMLTHIKSVDAWTKAAGHPPINVVFVIEGEEEVGSDNLDQFLKDHREKLKADVAVISDTSMYGPDIPAITYGLRGIVACEVTLTGPSQDLHSGIFGGAIANPCNELATLIGSLHDADGRVTVEGFYDDVRSLTDQERQAFADLPFDEATFCNNIGVKAPRGEAGFTTTERRWARPTCDVNGLFGGYSGEGPKTIVPSKATAKITCRLVPDQKPEAILDALKRHLEDRLPDGVTMSFMTYHGAPAFVMDPDHPAMAAASTAIDRAFGKPPVLIREGGSIPVVASLKSILDVDTLLLGWGQNTDNLHSPNERFSLKDFQRGIHASAALWAELAK
ncbi:dipeptidase [Stratiformator vulcanicus]|uniref:Succinyl-diaminopimelate desuccinylase n=1 Tax=Stratiformator vulcanicus TaxID=2527980 RepID=A0A517R1H3_9PLAN|nr:dipeptidase [Stratiformator vulcanicus]QDT37749.1 Succinyl-diaminopimelate desuccinylase [Stratiformator vulcanicus]